MRTGVSGSCSWPSRVSPASRSSPPARRCSTGGHAATVEQIAPPRAPHLGAHRTRSRRHLVRADDRHVAAVRFRRATGTVPGVPVRPLIAETYGAELRALGRSRGLDAVGIAPASVLQRARDALHERKAAGLHDGMAFT